MRRIAFRFWHIKKETYYSVANIDFVIERVTCFKYNDHAVEVFRFDEGILEQYADLQDKNGVELCEGDLMGHDCPSNSPDTAIVFEYGGFYVDKIPLWDVLHKHPKIAKVQKGTMHEAGVLLIDGEQV